MAYPVEKTDEQWRAQLSDEQYRVCRQRGTELPFSGAYCTPQPRGDYLCVCCGARLFTAEQQFESGCGWPSYSAPAEDKVLQYRNDTSHGMVREEVLCGQCGAHLGHVFPDGPPPSGLRYCINSVCLVLKGN